MFTTVKNNLTDEKTIFETRTTVQVYAFNKIRDWVENNLALFRVGDEQSCIVKREDDIISITGKDARITLKLTNTKDEAIKL